MTPEIRSTPPFRALRHRGLRIVTVSNGHATAEDLVLDHAEATDRFGGDVAALIFDDQRPGALDLTYRTAALRYGAPAAALIFPAGAGTQAPAVDDDGDDPPLALPLVDRDVS
jgi:hypothetical protein